jgi:hypothetical protein
MFYPIVWARHIYGWIIGWHLKFPGQFRRPYDPATLPSWAKALIKARETARLDGDRGTILVTHAKNVMYPEKDSVIRKLAKRHFRRQYRH